MCQLAGRCFDEHHRCVYFVLSGYICICWFYLSPNTLLPLVSPLPTNAHLNTLQQPKGMSKTLNKHRRKKKSLGGIPWSELRHSVRTFADTSANTQRYTCAGIITMQHWWVKAVETLSAWGLLLHTETQLISSSQSNNGTKLTVNA